MLTPIFLKIHNKAKQFPAVTETLQKLYVSTKFPYQKIRWNFSILRSVLKNACSQKFCETFMEISAENPAFFEKV